MDTTPTNTQAALSFLSLIVERKITEAFQTYVDMNGTHHNPFYPAGFAALQKGMEENDPNVPEKTIIIKNVVTENDLVVVHFQLILQFYEMAVVYIFRFKDTKIVELWECGMPIPADAPNK